MISREGLPEDVAHIADDIDRYEALGGLATTEGGKILVESFTEDVVSTVNMLANGFRTIPESELRALCASLAEKLNVLRILTRAPKNAQLASEALKEALQQ